MSGPEGVRTQKLKYNFLKTREDIPRDVAEIELDRLLKTLKFLTSCPLCGVTCEGVIVVMIV